MIQHNWFTVQEIGRNTYAISEYGHWEKVHSFLIVGKEKAALIDTGLGICSMKQITDQLTDLPIQVMTTHVHTDHIGSHSEYQEIYVHEGDADWLRNGIQGLSLEQIRRNIGRDISIPVPEAFHIEDYFPFTGNPAGLLKDKEVIDIGEHQLVIYHTPGHSPGHICIFDKTNGYLYTGDLLYDTAPVYAFYPSTSPSDLIRSWEKIAEIDGVTRVFGSHHTLGLEPSILHDAKQAAAFLRDHDLARFGTGLHHFDRFSVQF